MPRFRVPVFISKFNVVVRIALKLVVKFWQMCTTGMLILLLLYWLYGSLVAFGLLWAAMIGLAYNAQDMLLYYPDQPSSSRFFVESPSTFGLPYENLFVRAKDGVLLNLLLIKQPGPEIMKKAPTFVYLHGNAGNVGHRLYNSHGLHRNVRVNILLVEYRGYGKSGGVPSESGLSFDAECAIDYLYSRSDIDHSNIILFGRSLGGAVAISSAVHPTYSNKLRAIIVENTFTSLPDIARYIFDFKLLKAIPVWMYKNKYPSRERVKQMELPMLFISGLSDNLIPPYMMQDLFEHCHSLVKQMARFEAGTHNETWQCEGYYKSIHTFLNQVCSHSGTKDALRTNIEPTGTYISMEHI
ncbi:unnamed protein product [Owenia fusiformis]|uniref:Uncharacterized protein n=1 Tax=Owenia fusiformis TaxID=6347 RepID=A0A8S4N1M8_OWEFU|nr:unnamed protein product [Owenia fusiformis]